jgi:murein DD-endopeptidase MepM/ murein hydrolase activator NlpD
VPDNKVLSFSKIILLAITLICSVVVSTAKADGKHEFYFEVSRGDVFYKFFYSTGLSGKLLKKLMSSDERAQRLNQIHPGDKFKISLDDNHNLKRIVFAPLNANPMLISYSNQRFSFTIVNIQPTQDITQSTVTINKSLNYDAKKAGIEAEIIKLMVDNFSWEIDFSRDLRKGDKFVLAWDGEKTPCAMIYLGDRKTIALFAYKNPEGQKKYYTSEGKTLNDSFSFPPLKKYTRISSGYQKSRYHPTLKVWRSHLGTDFAAPKGTPIYATAKGVVKYLATLTGYGNVVYLKHGADYLTVYAHLAGFKKGLRSGDKVSKGQAIGFVGSTGQSTGPHLHYEIRLNGIHQDAEKFNPPKQSLVPSSAMASFKEKSNHVLSELGIRQTLF